MPLFALEQIVLLSFAVRESVAPCVGAVSLQMRSVRARETVYRQAGEQERVKRKKENTREVNHRLSSVRAFSGTLCSSCC